MAGSVVASFPPLFYEALKAEGFDLPRNVGDIELEIPVDGVFALRYRQMLEPDDLKKLGCALMRVAIKAEV